MPFKLPPLILHPFADEKASGTIAEGSRAGLMMNGALPRDGCTFEELERRFFAARYCEIRMLFYLGKDLERWIGQCAEFAAHLPELAGEGLSEDSFAALLVECAPPGVGSKLAGWGVHDYQNIFRRALGIRTLFQELPERAILGSEFLRYYYRFADHVFACRAELCAARRPQPGEFDFEIYASSEYSKMLERQWSA